MGARRRLVVVLLGRVLVRARVQGRVGLHGTCACLASIGCGSRRKLVIVKHDLTAAIDGDLLPDLALVAHRLLGVPGSLHSELVHQGERRLLVGFATAITGSIARQSSLRCIRID